MKKNFVNRAAKATTAPKLSTQNEPFPDVYPGGIHRDDLLDKRTRGIIFHYTVMLLRSGAFARYEEKDIIQEFGLRLHGEMHRFDPARGNRYAFTAMVAANEYKNMLKIRDRQLRRSRGFLSLQDRPEGSEDCWEDLISVEDCEEMTGWGGCGRAPHYEKVRDVFFASLEETDRAICEAFMEFGSAEQASKHTGIPARTILWRLRHPIHDKAVEAGMDEFFGGRR